MMNSENNPLRRELARSPLAGPHPDSDILTAFAEGELLQRERAEVFAHLATCAVCRELLSIATEAAPIPASGAKPFLLPSSPHRPSRAWLPWASIAASVIVVFSAGLLYKQKLEIKPRLTVANENPPAIPSADTRQPQSFPSAGPTVATAKTAIRSTSAELKALVPAKESIVQAPESQERSSLAVPPDLRRQDSQIESSSVAVPAPDGVLAGRLPPAPADSAFASAELHVIDKASVPAVVRSHWRINSIGQAERSFGNEAWEAVLPHEKARMRVVSVFNGDVWIGGENTRLYLSVDNGSTWSPVILPQKDGSEHAIAHIRFQSPHAGTVEATDGVTWTTADGGASWN
jgi:hypothetical protein